MDVWIVHIQWRADGDSDDQCFVFSDKAKAQQCMHNVLDDERVADPELWDDEDAVIHCDEMSCGAYIDGEWTLNSWECWITRHTVDEAVGKKYF